MKANFSAIIKCRGSMPAEMSDFSQRGSRSMDNNQWQKLVTNAMNGDKDAFETLYKETERSVYFLCLKLLGDEHNAKDVTQDTYMTALEKLSALDDGANFPKWINGIAVNKCKMHFRSTASASLEEQLEQGDEFTDDSRFIPDEYVSDSEKRRIIMNIIDTALSDVQRQTVILYYYNGFSVSEIAKLMECPEGTVTYRLSAARAKIKEKILSYEEKHDDRLHAVVPIPILTRILRYEAEHTAVPDIRLFANSSAAAASANNIASKASAGGKSAMTGTLKTKIIAGAISAVVVGGVITAGVLLSGGDEKSPAEISTPTKKNASVTQKENNDEVTEQGGVKFWLTSQDYSSEPLTSLPEDFTLLDVKLTIPITYEQLDEYFQPTYVSDDPSYGLSFEEAFRQKIISAHTEERIGNPYKDPHYNLYRKSTKKDDEYYDYNDQTYAKLYFFNYSDVDMTAYECFANNWWSIELDASNGDNDTYKYWGFSDEEVGGASVYNNEKSLNALNQIFQKLGTPTYYCASVSDQKNIDPLEIEKEQFTDELVLFYYTLAWEFDEYVVSIDVIETLYDNEDDVSIIYVSTKPKDKWLADFENNTSNPSNDIEFLLK